MAKQKFYKLMKATDEHAEHFEEVEKAKPVVIFDWIETFIHRTETNDWAVSEASTGTIVGANKWLAVGATQARAIEKAKEFLEHMGKDKVLEAIKKQIETHGKARIDEAENQMKLFMVIHNDAIDNDK